MFLHDDEPDGPKESEEWITWAQAKIVQLNEDLAKSRGALATAERNAKHHQQAAEGLEAWLRSRTKTVITVPAPGSEVKMLDTDGLVGRVQEVRLVGNKVKLVVTYWAPHKEYLTATLDADQVESTEVINVSVV